MADSSPITSMYASMTSWLTPTSLFLFLNLMIRTVLLTSRQQRRHNGSQFGYQNPQFVRTPSLLERVRSFNFSLYKFEEMTNPETQNVNPAQLNRSPSLLQRLKSINLSSFFVSDLAAGESDFPPETVVLVDPPVTNPDGSESGQEGGHLVRRSKSETVSEGPVRSSGRLKKSFSEKVVSNSRYREEEEEEPAVEARRPAMTRNEKRSETTSYGGDDEGVDAKADNFINRFKQQLRLQRLNSLLRYREMIKGN